jgi:hypothetical protein
LPITAAERVVALVEQVAKRAGPARSVAVLQPSFAMAGK